MALREHQDVTLSLNCYISWPHKFFVTGKTNLLQQEMVFVNRKMAAILLAGYIVCNLCACGIDDTTQSSASKSINSSTHSSDTTENKDYTRVEFSYGANGELYYRREYVYRDGTLEAVTSYRADGSESGHVDLVYDEHGNRLTDYSIHGIGAKSGPPNLNQDSGKVSPIEYEYEYDNMGNVAVKTRLYDRGERDIYEYSYDSAGHIISIKNHGKTRNDETGYVQSGWVYNETTNEYDSNGRLVTSKEQETRYDVSDLLQGIYTPVHITSDETFYEYSSDGKLIASRGQHTAR